MIETLLEPNFVAGLGIGFIIGIFVVDLLWYIHWKYAIKYEFYEKKCD